MGFIGVGGQGRGHLLGGAWTYLTGGYTGRNDVQVLGVCDVRRERREDATKRVNQHYAGTRQKGSYKACKAYTDFRDILARDDIDAVLIATPIHWHALMTIMAAKAGKDVYCEKPTALTIRESRAMADAIRRYGRVFQAGTQQRSEYGGKFRLACELVRSGRIGELKHVYAYKGGAGVNWVKKFGPGRPVPVGFDWDLFLGPAPHSPYGTVGEGAHYFGTGSINWGQHHYDIVQWGIGADDTGPVEIGWEDGKLAYRYANGVVVYGCVPPGDKWRGGGACFVVRLAALGALAGLADESALADMVGLLVRSESDGERRGAEAALASVLARSSKKEECVGSVLAGLAGASGPARCALVRVAGRAGGPSVLQVLRKAVHDDDPAVRDAAIRTMTGTCGLDAAPDLLGLAIGAKTLTHRVLALRGYWRLAALATELPLEERWQMCKAAMAACERPQERRLGLAQLATVPHIGALKLAEDLCTEEGVRAEAEVACVSIAAGLHEPHLDEASNALRRLAAQAQDKRTRAEAQRALAAMDQDVDVEYIPTWFVAGPYRQEGKECTTLFDVAFPPEKHGSAGMFAWQPAPPPSAPSKSWQADLGEVARGNHCVVYLKARVSVPQAQKVRLDITSDDGVKLWVNGQLVHANNAVRGMKRDEDRAEADLRQGANEVLLKITQHTMGCGAAVRIRNPDGSVVKGLRFW